MTYSIVCYDPVEMMFGVGVVSGSIAVGSRVPWARYPVGAVATQAYTNPSLGPIILDYLSQGIEPGEALYRALATDPEPEKRQVAVIDGRGRKAVHSGLEIPFERGQHVASNAVCIANLVVDPSLPRILCNVFEEEFPIHGLVEAMLTALGEAEALGGDKRGDRSAALLVVGKTGYGDYYDRILDVRVDYDPGERPVRRLREIIVSLRGFES